MKIKELKAKKAKLNESVQHDLRQIDEEMKLLKRKLNDEWLIHSSLCSRPPIVND